MVKLLIVDDELSICDLLSNFFSMQNYEVFIATKREEALSIAREKKPNIVLLDILMPDDSGLYILDQIKKIDDKIKVVMMTAVNDQAAMDLAKKYGASDYIIKPFRLKHLEKDILPKILKQLV